jgi:hypothetical protein
MEYLSQTAFREALELLSESPLGTKKVIELKQLAGECGLSRKGKKKDLIERIYFHHYLTPFVVRIQRLARRSLFRILWRQYSKPLAETRLNDCDCITLESLDSLPSYRVFYLEEKGKGKGMSMSYGFDVLSLAQITSTTSSSSLNPYTRTVLDDTIKERISRIFRMGSLPCFSMSFPETLVEKYTMETTVQLRVVRLFGLLQNYSNPQWFLDLDKDDLIQMIHFLYDIWNFRAGISPEVKRELCPPHGEPFQMIMILLLSFQEDIWHLRNKVLDCCEQLVPREDCLGGLYVLTALTLVSEEAAEALPWLYQAAVS